jgi:hypothetical protein
MFIFPEQNTGLINSIHIAHNLFKIWQITDSVTDTKNSKLRALSVTAI